MCNISSQALCGARLKSRWQTEAWRTTVVAECDYRRGPTVHDDLVVPKCSILWVVHRSVWPEIVYPKRSLGYWIHLSICLGVEMTSEAMDDSHKLNLGQAGGLMPGERGAWSRRLHGVEVIPRVKVRRVKGESVERGSG
ncbi:hypothetical protein GUJ93_ZPchr0005g16134 [Zizania palustris]|uniref:Uncharacterized protein n=1 Tax=Zizania palustris TaxID=103762 RepID=A0A8J5S560_ZIZPA|nr:hypothetical protein GUJ93_ZPchr0005g16134 [Zizania palustris]